MRQNPPSVDVMIVGGGPAGLSAALLLGRCLRRVVVCDAGRPRNESSPAMHGYLGHDGVSPADFLEQCRDQLQRYKTVSMVHQTVVEVMRNGTGFSVRAENGATWDAKALLICTGLVDKLPQIPRIREFYGKSVLSCPYCDAWEHRGKRLGVIGSGKESLALALELEIWSPHVTLFTNEPKGTSRPHLPFGSVALVVEGEVEGLNGSPPELQGLQVAGGHHPCDALFFSPEQFQHSNLAASLGCRMVDDQVQCPRDGSTGISGLFVAGNASRGVQMAIVAAAEGLQAAATINDWLLDRNRSYLAEKSRSRASFVSC